MPKAQGNKHKGLMRKKMLRFVNASGSKRANFKIKKM